VTSHPRLLPGFAAQLLLDMLKHFVCPHQRAGEIGAKKDNVLAYLFAKIHRIKVAPSDFGLGQIQQPSDVRSLIGPPSCCAAQRRRTSRSTFPGHFIAPDYILTCQRALKTPATEKTEVTEKILNQNHQPEIPSP
jgi:hypothetical protein